MDDRQLPRSPFGEPRRPSQLAPMTEWRVQRSEPDPAFAAQRGIERQWILWGGALLVLIVGVTLWFSKPDVADLIAATPVPEKPVPKQKRGASSYAPVELPSGLQIDRVSVANYDLAAWLAQNPAHSRTFVFDRVGFDYGAPDIRDQDRPALQVLSQILTAYPQARITVIGNGPGTLAQERTKAIYDALLALAVDPAQVAMRAGDGSETAPRMEAKIEMGSVDGLDA